MRYLVRAFEGQLALQDALNTDYFDYQVFSIMYVNGSFIVVFEKKKESKKGKKYE